MKKFFALIVSIVYLSSSAGATLHLHYCKDKLVTSAMPGKGDTRCDNCGMQKDGGCCKDEIMFLKNSSDQDIAKTKFHFNDQLTAISLSIFDKPVIISEAESSAVPACDGPLRTGTDILIRNCVFRI